MVFGIEKSKSEYEKHIGKWFHLYNQNWNTPFSGKIKKVDGEGNVILNPFVGFDYIEKTYPLRKIIEGDLEVKVNDVSMKEPLSIENVKAYCDYCNEEMKKQYEKRESKK